MMARDDYLNRHILFIDNNELIDTFIMIIP
jgi:hypothetical protein